MSRVLDNRRLNKLRILFLGVLAWFVWRFLSRLLRDVEPIRRFIDGR